MELLLMIFPVLFVTSLVLEFVLKRSQSTAILFIAFSF